MNVKKNKYDLLNTSLFEHFFLRSDSCFEMSFKYWNPSTQEKASFLTFISKRMNVEPTRVAHDQSKPVSVMDIKLSFWTRDGYEIAPFIILLLIQDVLFYIQLTSSFLVGRKCTVNFRNQRLKHLTADYTIIMSRTLKVTSNHVMYDRGVWFLRIIMSSSRAICS